MARKKAIPFLFDDDMFDDDKDGLPIPHFSVQEAAKGFFGRSSDWLRWRYRPDRPTAKGGGVSHFPQGYFILDGEPVEAKMTDKGARYYTLADIERMAYALAQNRVLSHEELQAVLISVAANAALNGIVTKASARFVTNATMEIPA